MKYNPARHRRRSIRLKGYDYTQPGAYFVTICLQERTCLFGDVVDGKMALNVYGRVAHTLWERIPRHFPRVQSDAFVVMPNHVHGIIVIVGDTGGRGEAFPDITCADERGIGLESVLATQGDAENASPLHVGPPPGSLGAIVGNFKAVAARRINRVRKTPGVPVWQRNYYEHIIRNERELDAIRRYIEHNPARWEQDRYHD